MYDRAACWATHLGSDVPDKDACMRVVANETWRPLFFTRRSEGGSWSSRGLEALGVTAPDDSHGFGAANLAAGESPSRARGGSHVRYWFWSGCVESDRRTTTPSGPSQDPKGPVDVDVRACDGRRAPALGAAGPTPVHDLRRGRSESPSGRPLPCARTSRARLGVIGLDRSRA